MTTPELLLNFHQAEKALAYFLLCFLKYYEVENPKNGINHLASC